ncbi:MAG: hypothetical protein Q4B57_10485 [Eubacteriales bacterium]|nr:hypothetical protein [Eubacteriales bacterium]
MVDQWFANKPLHWDEFQDALLAFEKLEGENNEDLANYLQKESPDMAVSESDCTVHLIFADQIIETEQFSENPETFEQDKYYLLAEYLVEQLFLLRIETPLYSTRRKYNV